MLRMPPAMFSARPLTASVTAGAVLASEFRAASPKVESMVPCTTPAAAAAESAMDEMFPPPPSPPEEVTADVMVSMAGPAAADAASITAEPLERRSAAPEITVETSPPLAPATRAAAPPAAAAASPAPDAAADVVAAVDAAAAQQERTSATVSVTMYDFQMQQQVSAKNSFGPGVGPHLRGTLPNQTANKEAVDSNKP